MLEDDSVMPKDQKAFNDYIAKEVREMRVQLSLNNETTEEIASIIRSGKGFFRTVAAIGRWIRRFILWLGPIAAALAGLYQLFREFFKVKGG